MINKKDVSDSAFVLIQYTPCDIDDSLQVLQTAMLSGIDGFKLYVKPAKDGVCVVTHGLKILPCRDELQDEAQVETMSYLPLVDVLELPLTVVNIELMGEHGWKQALAAVEASGALSRVIFSSFEHSEVLQLWSACHEARCGLSWEDNEAMDLTHETLSDLPTELKIVISLKAAGERRDFWEQYRSRLVVCGASSLVEANLLGFRPFVLVIGEPLLSPC